MSSTNKTTNYNLSQYIGSDKPTYLSDYNSDMSKIDAQMKVNADNVATAIQGATDASSLATTANSTATTANTNANTAIANNATTNTNLNNFMLKFNLDTHKNWQTNDVTVSGISFTAVEAIDLYLATNSDGSIFKFYGQISATANGQGFCEIVCNNTGIAVDTPYTIFPCGTISNSTGNPARFTQIYVENNKITLQWWNESSGPLKAIIMPCLYFNGDFGDDPNNQ